jgi:transposase-like protein
MFGERISSGLRDRQLSMTCHVPYQRARNFVHQCLGVSCSPKRIRKDLDTTAQQIRQLPTKAVGKVVYQDATKVKAGPKQRGVSIHMAITAEPNGQRWGRNQMRKRLLFLKTGDGRSIKESLKSLGAGGIIHDGEMDLSGCAKRLQRGLWHLPHQLQHFLWMDGVAWEQRKPSVKELIHVLYKSSTPSKMENRYRQFINKLKCQGLTNSFTHLQRAEQELSTSRRHHFDYHTTAPAEREMREINRRADIGVRWSIPGIENLLLVKTWYRLNKPEG